MKRLGRAAVALDRMTIESPPVVPIANGEQLRSIGDCAHAVAAPGGDQHPPWSSPNSTAPGLATLGNVHFATPIAPASAISAMATRAPPSRQS